MSRIVSSTRSSGDMARCSCWRSRSASAGSSYQVTVTLDRLTTLRFYFEMMTPKCVTGDVTSVYVNYPNPYFSLEHGRSVEERARHEKVERRVLKITAGTFEAEIGRLQRGEIRFASTRELNDLWLEIDFEDEAFERHVAEYVQRLFGRLYAPLAHAKWR